MRFADRTAAAVTSHVTKVVLRRARRFALAAVAVALAASVPQTAGAQVSFVTSGTGQGVTATTCSPGIPAGTAANDILVAVLHSRTVATHTCTTNCNGVGQGGSNWAEFSTQNGSTNRGQLSVWWLRRGAAVPAAPTFGGPATAESYACRIFAFRGVETSGNPWDVLGSNTAQNAAATWTGSALTTTVANAMVVFVGGSYNNNGWGPAGGSVTLPASLDTTCTISGLCVANANGTNNSVFLAYDATPTNAAGAQLAPTNGLSASTAGRWFTFALKPVPPQVPGTPTAALPTTTTGMNVSWTAVSGATSYTLEVDDENTFAAPLAATYTTAATSQAVSGLSANTLYYLRATSDAGANWSAIGQATTLSNAPGTPSFSGTTTSGTTVTWTAPAGNGAASLTYTLERATNDTFTAGLVTTPGLTGSSTPVTGLSQGVTYWFRVRAVNAGGTSAASPSNSMSPLSAPPVPGIPSSTAATTSGFTATWAVSAGATSYTLDVDGDVGFTAPLVGTYSPATNSQAVASLAANTLYYLRASATGPGGTSVYSSTGQGTTLSNAPGTPSFSATTSAQTTVSWAAPVGNGGASLTYLLERATDAGFTQSFVSTPGIAGTSSLQSGLLASTRYYFRVKAVNAGGTSAASPPNSVLTPAGGGGGGTTTIGDGVALGGTSVCPDGASAPLDAFTAGATVSADLVTSVTVQLSPAGAYQNVALVQVTDPADPASIVYGSTVPSSDTVVVQTSGLAAPLGTPGSYRIRVTPRAHAAMPPRSVGRSVSATGLVTAIASANATKAYADTTSGTVTIDNGSPVAPTWSAVTTGTNAITVGWSYASPADVAQVLVLRRQGGPVTDAPTEGVTSFGATLGASTVVYQGSPATTSRAMTDTPDGTPFYFAAYARDACGNWSLGQPLGPIVPPGAMEGDPTLGSTRPVVSIVNPAKNAVVTGTFRVQVRVASPAAGGVVSSVRLSTSGGSPTCDAASFPIVLCASPRYGTTAQGGVWETQSGVGGCSDHLTLTAGAGYTLRACAVNGSGSVNSAAVGITVSPASRPGDGKLLVRDDSNQLCTDCHAVKAHDAEATSGKYGSWSSTCRDCHTPHGTTNVLLVAPVIQPPQYRGYQPPKKVVFTNRTGSGTGNPGDGSFTNADGTGACQICHTQTRFYRADNSQPETHETGDCKGCHGHEEGMSGAGGCSNCHGDDARIPATGSDAKVKYAPPRDHTGATAVTDPQVGAHEKHVNNEGSTLRSPPLACDECHLGYVHADNDVDIGWGAIATTGGRIPTWNVPAGSYGCATTYCHAGMPGGTTPAPVWTSTAGTLACSSCHGAPPPITANHPQNTTCGTCHAGYTSSTIADTSKHVNGVVEATLRTGCTACHGTEGRTQLSSVGTADANLAAAPPIDSRGRSAPTDAGVGAHLAHADPGRAKGWSKPFSCDECHTVPASGTAHADGAYAFSPGTIAGALSYSGAPGYTCSNTYCHALAGAGGLNQTPGWTGGSGQTSCTSCHQAPPPVADGGHPQNTTCASCHAGYDAATQTVVASTHVDGVKDHSPASGCNQCHGDLSAAPAAPGTVAAAPGVNTGSVDTRGGTAVTALGVGAHREHLVTSAAADAFACADCHLANYAVGDVAHANSTASVPMNGLAKTGGAAGSYASPNCSSVYCHSRAFPLGGTQAYATPIAWNGGATITGCTACHDGQGSVATPTNLSPVHRVHADSGAGNYAFACAKCHANVVSGNTTISAGGLALHVNGSKTWLFDAWQPNATYAANTCTNTYCHSSGADRTGPDFTSAATPSWNGGTITTCTACHGGPVGAGQIATGKHANHVNLAGTIGGAASTNVFCGTCHSTTVATGTNAPIATYSNHVDQQPDVVLDAAWGGTYSLGATEGTGSCASNYCHSTGQDPAATNAARYKTIAWTATLGCDGCHGAETGAGTTTPKAGAPNYQNGGTGAAGANTHDQHVSGAGDCQKCHVQTVTATGTGILATSALHLDRSRQVGILSAYDGNGGTPGDNYNTTSKQCSSVTCHGGNPVTWGGPPLGCSGCHLASAVTAGLDSDIDDYAYDNGTTARLDRDDWQTYGHGANVAFTESGNTTAGTSPNFGPSSANGNTLEGCLYCHAPSTQQGSNAQTSTHGDAANPFRLANENWSGKGKNGTCLVCHDAASTPPGYDPDGTGGTYTALKAASTNSRVNAYHYGAEHTKTGGGEGGQLCWDCHDPHGDRSYGTNDAVTTDDVVLAYMVQEQPVRTHVAADPNGWGIPTTAELAPVPDFRNNRDGTAGWAWGDYVSNTLVPATTGTYRGLCQVCHTAAGTDPAANVGHFRQNLYESTHNPGQICTNCHKHTQAAGSENLAFKGEGSCRGCHGNAQGTRVAVTNDFVRQSRHVSNGTTTSIVTDYDCILCHAEGDLTSTGAGAAADIKTASTNHGGDGGTTTVDLRDVDSSGGTGIAAAWTGTRGTPLANGTANTAVRDAMDTFCMNCHDANGAATVAVNAANDGMLTGTGYWINANSGQVARATNVVTVNTTAAHGLAVNNTVFLEVPTEATFPPGVKVVTSVPTTTRFTYAETAANATSTRALKFIRVAQSNSGQTSRGANSATVTVNTTQAHGFVAGDKVLLRTGSNNTASGATTTYTHSYYFRAGVKTVATATATQFTYAEDTTASPNPTAAQTSNQVFLFTKSIDRAVTPFNTADRLAGSTRESAALRAWRWQANGRLVDVKGAFNSANAAQSGWASHHNLNQFTKRYNANNVTYLPVAAWSTYATKEGQRLDGTAAGQGVTAGLHCSDCHLNEANAHGSVNTYYLLSDSTGADAAFTGTSSSTSNDNCVKCHAVGTYSLGNSSTASRTDAHNSANGRCNRWDQANIALLASNGTTTTISCLGCHGGMSPGMIHGTNGTYNPAQGAYVSKQYRFMGTGGSMRWYSPSGTTTASDASWGGTTAVACYTIGSSTPADTFGGCTQHTSLSGTTPNNRARPLDY